MPKTLYLIDLDLTLVNENYEPVVSSDIVGRVAQELIARGNRIGIISDSPIEVIEKWMRIFNFRGPLIAERGACIVHESKRSEVVLLPRINWQKLCEALVIRLLNAIPSLEVRKELYLEAFQNPAKESPGTLILLFNPHRRCSLSMHMRKIGEKGRWLHDESFFSSVIDVTKCTLAELPETWIEIDANISYGVCILSDPSNQKSISIPALRKAYPDFRIVAIGDGITEIPLSGVVDELWAVGNAQKKLKTIADRVASTSITQGVIELLRRDCE